jgi:hypothetical protein
MEQEPHTIQEDLYSILGISPAVADPKKIKCNFKKFVAKYQKSCLSSTEVLDTLPKIPFKSFNLVLLVREDGVCVRNIIQS